MSKRNIAAVGRVKQLATNQLCCNKWCLFFFCLSRGGQGGRQKSEPSNLGDWICCDTCWQCFDHLWPPDHGIVIRYFSTKWSLGKPFGSMRWIANLNAKNFDRWPSQVFVKFWPIPNWDIWATKKGRFLRPDPRLSSSRSLIEFRARGLLCRMVWWWFRVWGFANLNGTQLLSHSWGWQVWLQKGQCAAQSERNFEATNPTILPAMSP